MASKKIILLGLNELNFDYIKHYVKQGLLPNFKHVFESYQCVETTSESEYKLLEPWIQWCTIHTGKTYAEHKVFRLGDIVNRKDLKQIFETAEEHGLTVGAISPFNADNRLKKPAFFVPDPWTQTTASGDAFVKNISEAAAQAVNDNAKGSLSKKSILSIIKTYVKVVAPAKYGQYLKLATGLKTKIGVKAVIFDKLLGDLFLHQWKKKQPDFSNLFLNTGAHFQHHYMFNSAAYDGELSNPDWYCPKTQDPLLMVLKVYDQIIGSLLKLDARLLIATGLHQKPHKHNTFYWRLDAHTSFLNTIGIDDFKSVIPRMSRDFLIEFNNAEDALAAQKELETYRSTSDNTAIFTVDNRVESLFVELTYPNNIENSFGIKGSKSISNFEDYVSFVAIKNGEHHNVGYYIDTAVPKKLKTETMPLASVYNAILKALHINN
ncbi:MAG: hypothetical protein ACPGUH_03550 [Winogradskyella sp.]